MGTETFPPPDEESLPPINDVKLNNPLMGTETRFSWSGEGIMVQN